MPSATVAYVIAGTVHNDTVKGHRISVTRKGRGGTITVYNKRGRRVRGLLYSNMARVEISYGEGK